LTPELKEARATWADVMLEMSHHAGWYFRHIVWMDPCYTIVPGRPKTVFDQQQFNYGKGRRWMSGDSKDSSMNLRSSAYTNKTTQWGDKKVWWFIVVAAGKVRIHVVGEDWHQDPQGMAQVFPPTLSPSCHSPFFPTPSASAALESNLDLGIVFRY